jgi:SAM-dependent methyltransferase
MLKPNKSTHGSNSVDSSLPTDLSLEIKEGSILVGDDFTGEQLKKWFAQEKEAYYIGDAGSSETDYWYAYMRFINQALGFSRIDLSNNELRSILVLGPGSGIEVDQFISENPDWSLFFVEASDNFKAKLKSKYPLSQIVDATISGDILLENDSQDVICAFSVLHHIPNVSYLLREAYRVMKPGGLLLIREPCSSMGDWRYSRAATPNERGLGLRWFTSAVKTIGFEMQNRPIPILFTPINRLLKKIGLDSMMPSKMFYSIDRLVSKIVSVNDHYWRDTWYKKIGPSAYFYVLRKPDAK